MQVGVGFILFIVFLILKLTEVIDWSWWWITSPVWVPAAILILVQGLGLATIGLATKKGLTK